jgi:rhodanese-related sulfurtransferase
VYDDDLPSVSATEAQRLTRSEALLLDVREEHEWLAGHAPDATHIPMSRIGERVAELPTDRPIVCVCHLGSRSAAVAEALNRAGWQALNLDGGMAAWAAAGLPVVTDAGAPGIVA